MDWTLFPEYLKRQKKDSEYVQFDCKLGEIRKSLQNEFNHYDNMKTEKKQNNKSKKRMKVSNLASEVGIKQEQNDERKQEMQLFIS